MLVCLDHHQMERMQIKALRVMAGMRCVRIILPHGRTSVQGVPAAVKAGALAVLSM